MEEPEFGALNLNKVNKLLEACLEDLLKRAENGSYHSVMRFAPIEQGKKVYPVNIGFVDPENEWFDLFSVKHDLARECWIFRVCSDEAPWMFVAGRDGYPSRDPNGRLIYMETGTLPLQLTEVLLPWVVSEILKVYRQAVDDLNQQFMTLEQNGQDLTESLDADHEYYRHFDHAYPRAHVTPKDLWGITVLNWIAWVEVLFEIAEGGSAWSEDSGLGPPSRAYALWALRFEANRFWEWVEEDSLGSVDWGGFNPHVGTVEFNVPPYNVSLLDFEGVKKRFRSAGLGDGFRLTMSDYFDTSGLTSFLETEVEDVKPIAAEPFRNRDQSSIGTSSPGKKLGTGLSWLISLLVGTAIAIGAAMGF